MESLQPILHMINYCFILLVLNHFKSSLEFGSNIVDDNHTIVAPVQEASCHDFITPIVINEKEYIIQSPKYPNSYPTNVDCFHIIKAPESNMIINIEFREKFEIEESKNCLHDFLQINDGPFGFSKTISKLCGKETSREIFQSSGRYVWLRFYSDKTLTGFGFKLIYKFLRNPDRNMNSAKICYRKLTIPGGYSVLLNSDSMKKYQLTNDFKGIGECVFDIAVREESNIFISMSHLNNTGMTLMNQFIEIYDRITTPIRVANHKSVVIINEKSNFDKLFLQHQRAVIRISFKSMESIMVFQLVLTALVNRSMEKCSEDEYMCERSFCISKKLICNKLINCPNGDDEKCYDGKLIQNDPPIIIHTTTDPDSSNEKGESLPEKDQYHLHGLILGAITLLLLFMLIGFIIHSVRQSRLNSKTNLKPNKETTLVHMDKVTENKPVKPTTSSTMTLTTDVLSKKLYNQPKSKEISNNQYKNNNYPISVFSKSGYYENENPQSMSNFPSRESCSPELINLSKSISNVNRYIYYEDSEHLPGCKSLPNFSAESVNNLFEDEDYPVVEEVTVNKPLRIKYYA